MGATCTHQSQKKKQGTGIGVIKLIKIEVEEERSTDQSKEQEKLNSEVLTLWFQVEKLWSEPLLLSQPRFKQIILLKVATQDILRNAIKRSACKGAQNPITSDSVLMNVILQKMEKMRGVYMELEEQARGGIRKDFVNQITSLNEQIQQIGTKSKCHSLRNSSTIQS